MPVANGAVGKSSKAAEEGWKEATPLWRLRCTQGTSCGHKEVSLGRASSFGTLDIERRQVAFAQLRVLDVVANGQTLPRGLANEPV